jgi:excisionase family DNA binding protein
LHNCPSGFNTVAVHASDQQIPAKAPPKRRRRAPVRADAPPKTRYVDIETVAGIANVSTRTVRRWIKDGRLPAYQLAGRGLIRIDLRDLDKVIAPVDPARFSA